MAPRSIVNRLLGECVASVQSSELPPKEKIQLYDAILRTGHIADPALMERLSDLWAELVVQEIGKDSFRSRLLSFLKRVENFGTVGNRRRAAEALAERARVQSDSAGDIERAASHLSGRDRFAAALGGVLGELGLDRLTHHPRARRAMLDFLISPLTEESVNKIHRYIDDLRGYGIADNKGTPSIQLLVRTEDEKDGLRYVYDAIRGGPLGIRTLVCKDLLLPPGRDNARERRRAIERVLSRLSCENEGDADELKRIIKVYFSCNKPYQIPVLLSALMMAADPSKGPLRIGEAIAVVGSALGPGEFKLIQAAHGHPGTPEYMRPDLAVSKFLADPPSIPALHRLIKIQVPRLVRGEIVEVGPIRGCGAFFITVDVLMRDNKWYVLQILRRNAAARAEAGLEIIGKAAAKLSKRDPKYRLFSEMKADAERSWREEVDRRLALRKFRTAQRAYNPLTVDLGGEKFTFRTPQIYQLESGRLAWGSSFRIVERIFGEPFVKSVLQGGRIEQLKKVAKAVSAVTLGRALRGQSFDDDCHGGNVLVSSGNEIGWVDFGGMVLSDAEPAEMRQLGEVLAQSFEGGGTDIAAAYYAQLRERHSEGRPISPLLRRFQKLLLSLQDYVRLLDQNERLELLGSVIGSVHPEIESSMRAHFGAAWDSLKAALTSSSRIAVRSDIS